MVYIMVIQIVKAKGQVSRLLACSNVQCQVNEYTQLNPMSCGDPVDMFSSVGVQ